LKNKISNPDNFLVKKSRNGKGVFAMKDFAANEILFEIKGELLSGYIDEEIEDKVRDNMIRFDADYYISPKGEIGDFLNHSCEPNSYIVKKHNKLFLISLLPISKNHEVLMDYSIITGSDDVWQMDCNCGAESCRGVVKSFDKLPKGLRQRYEKFIYF
jgi:SET domain-containing protein